MNISGIVKSPQMLVSAIAAAVAVLGTVGILTGVQSSSLQGLLAAVLGVLTAFGHAATSKSLADRQATAALRALEGPRPPLR